MCSQSVKNLVIAACGVLLVASVPASAADPQPTTRPSRSRFHLTDAPANRIGGASRGSKEELNLYVTVLAPSGGGYASTPQPTLFWYLSKKGDRPYKIELTINDNKAKKTIFQTDLPEPKEHGIQRIDLAKLVDEDKKPARLEPNRPYEWFITVLVHEKQDQAENPDASGYIEYRPPSAQVKHAIEQAQGALRVEAFDAAGEWYDELAGLESDLKDDPRLLKRHQQFLAGEGLREDDHRVITDPQAKGRGNT
jgi:hypothetical protein